MAKLRWRIRFPRWLSNFFWPGDHDRDSAKVAYKTYTDSKDVASLNTAIKNFKLAVEQYRKHKNPSLSITLINYAVAVWKRYEDVSHSPDDLHQVIHLDTEARKSWSGEKNAKTYLFLLNALARAYFEQYQRAFGPSPIKPGKKQEAFDKAVRYLTRLGNSPAATGSQRSATRLQLGVIFRVRCELEQTLDCFDIGVQHLQDALSEATESAQEINTGSEGDEAKQSMEAAEDNIKATCLLNLAALYEIRYDLVQDFENIRDLTMAINYNASAGPLLDTLERPELPTCMFNLARQFYTRWRQTRNQSDYDTAKQMADAAKAIPGLDQVLVDSIDELLTVLQPGSQLGTLDSVLTEVPSTPDTLVISRRRDTVLTIDPLNTTTV